MRLPVARLQDQSKGIREQQPSSEGDGVSENVVELEAQEIGDVR